MTFVFHEASWVYACIVLVVALLPCEKVFHVFIYCIPATTIALFDVNNNSVLFYHIIFLILVMKYFFQALPSIRFKTRQTSKTNVSPMLWVFVIYCALTIPLAGLHTDTIVLNIENEYAFVKPAFQQVTQYLYLLIGFIACIVTNGMLQRHKSSSKTILRIIDYSYLAVMLLALLQKVIPADTISILYRNSVNTSYAFDGARISSTFQEPSMLSLFMTPMFCVYLWRVLKEFSMKNVLYLGLGTIVISLNQSSSFFVGLFASIFAFILIKISTSAHISTTNLTLRQALKVLIATTLCVIFAFAFWGQISAVIQVFLSKLQGEGVSGSVRAYAALHHFHVFLEHPLFGVGYGTVRSYDLLTTWLAQIGLLGFLLYAIPVVALCVRLLKVNTDTAKVYFIIIVAYNAILMVSTSEIAYFLIWVVYGASYHEITNAENVHAEQISHDKIYYSPRHYVPCEIVPMGGEDNA